MCQVCAHVFVVILTSFFHQFAVDYDYDYAGKDSVHHMKEYLVALVGIFL